MIYLKTNDRLPKYAATLTDETGTPYNLAGCAVTLSMRSIDGGPLKVDGETMTVVSPTAGTVEYSWAAADTDTAGHYLAEVTITWPGDLPQTVPSSGVVDVLIEDPVTA